MGISGLGSVYGYASVPDLRPVQDGVGRAVSRRVQRVVALAVGRLHRVDHYSLLHWTWRYNSSQHGY